MTTPAARRPALALGHRPLNWLAAASVVGSLVVTVLYFTDSRELLGVSVWEKPLKFLLSTAIYAATFSWFHSLVGAGKRIVWWLGTLIASMLVLELVIIIGLASVGLTSHFNVSNGFQITMWSLMATGISTLWLLSFAVGAYLWSTTAVDPVIRDGIRWGVVIGLLGMGLAFTMTSPTPNQLADFEGIAGAHTVGTADGGPGLPFLGWSTIGGDLRISHFVGLHALQALPLVAIILVRLVSSDVLQRALLHGAGVTYILLVAVVYLQALAGEPITSPSTLTGIGVALSLALGAITSSVMVYLRRRPVKTV
jgi:hypothetical protein